MASDTDATGVPPANPAGSSLSDSDIKVAVASHIVFEQAYNGDFDGVVKYFDKKENERRLRAALGAREYDYHRTFDPDTDEPICSCEHSQLDSCEFQSNKADSLDFSELLKSTDLLVRSQASVRRCQNSGMNVKDPKGLWVRDPAVSTVGKAGFLTQIAHLCLRSRLVACNNDVCRDRRTSKRLQDIAPECDWTQFRDWAVTAIACQDELTDSGFGSDRRFLGDLSCLGRGHTHIARAVAGCCMVLSQCIQHGLLGKKVDYLQGDEGTDNGVTVNGVINIIYWMAKIQYEKDIGPSRFGRWGSRLFPIGIASDTLGRDVLEVMRHRRRGVCQARFWDMVNISDRRQNDIPDLVNSVKSLCLYWSDEGHARCVASRCQMTNLSGDPSMTHKCSDDPERYCEARISLPRLPNETRVDQNLSDVRNAVHQTATASVAKGFGRLQTATTTLATRTFGKTGSAAAQDLTAEAGAEAQARAAIYTPSTWASLIDKAVKDELPTAWLLDGSGLVKDPDTPYMAISHVWADGTGCDPSFLRGTIRRCLFDFWCNLARHDNIACEGIWWDAISVPLEPTLRKRALSTMNDNYREAKVTVVHDQGLLKIPWSGDGLPCIAIVLSTWFTRGWTALELAVSSRVLVLFKNNNPKSGDPYILKDLDQDILASSPTRSSRAWWLASTWIRRLRRPMNDVGDILSILKSRTTAKASDRPIIAALLANVRDVVNAVDQGEAELTKEMIRFLGRIPQNALLHGKPTINLEGPWDWCPASLDDMPIEIAADVESERASEILNTLDVDDAGAVEGEWWFSEITKDNEPIIPYGDDLIITTNVQLALEDWRSCLVLRIAASSREDAAILVRPVGVGLPPKNNEDAKLPMSSRIPKPPGVEDGRVWICQYVGAVVDEREEVGLPPKGGLTEKEGPWHFIRIKIGVVVPHATRILGRDVKAHAHGDAFDMTVPGMKRCKSCWQGQAPETGVDDNNSVADKSEGPCYQDDAQDGWDDLARAIIRGKPGAVAHAAYHCISLGGFQHFVTSSIRPAASRAEVTNLIGGLWTLGDVLLQRGDYDRAAQTFIAAQAAYGQNGPGQGPLPIPYEDATRDVLRLNENVANVLNSQGHSSAALEVFEEILRKCIVHFEDSDRPINLHRKLHQKGRISRQATLRRRAENIQAAISKANDESRAGWQTAEEVWDYLHWQAFTAIVLIRFARLRNKSILDWHADQLWMSFLLHILHPGSRHVSREETPCPDESYELKIKDLEQDDGYTRVCRIALRRVEVKLPANHTLVSVAELMLGCELMRERESLKSLRLAKKAMSRALEGFETNLRPWTAAWGTHWFILRARWLVEVIDRRIDTRVKQLANPAQLDNERPQTGDSSGQQRRPRSFMTNRLKSFRIPK